MTRTPIRRAQLVAPFGVGSLYTGSDGVATIAAGLDHWYRQDDGSYTDVDLDEFQVREWRLQKILGVGQLRLPPDYREPFGFGPPEKTNLRLNVPLLRFPRWHFCPKSSCRALVDKPQTSTGYQWCPVCESKADQASSGKKRKSKLAQVRFIAVCSNGHCQDFPWREWVHRSAKRSCDGNLRLTTTGGASLASQRVECDCGVKPRSLAGITQASIDGDKETSVLSETLDDDGVFLCRGQRPWLGDLSGEGCDRPLRGSLRSGANVYYAHIESSIYIPPSDTKLNPKLEELLTEPPLSTWIKTVTDLGIAPSVDTIRASENGNLLVPFDDVELEQGLTAISASVITEDAISDDELPDDQLTQAKIRRPEYRKLRDNLDAHELLVRRMDPLTYGEPVRGSIHRINLVDSLRETRALYGFSRVIPTNRTYREHRNRLWLNEPGSFGHNWLPAYVVNGEGLYLELDEDRVSEWETKYSEKRLRILQANDDLSRLRRQQEPRELSGRYVLIHTLAHLLINRLIFECGYSSASLRERLYVAGGGDPMAGMLIYTAAGDSEGTMGGLVRMGKPGNLEPVFAAALVGARWCSADPVCMELGQAGQGPESCNLAACHSCCLLPETSCESFNRLLDRAAVVGTHEDPSLGFFDELDLQVR